MRNGDIGQPVQQFKELEKDEGKFVTACQVGIGAENKNVGKLR